METIKRPSSIKEWLTNKIQGLVYRLDNTGNCDFDKNGEINFIKSLSKKYTNKDFTFFDIGANRGDFTEIVLKNIDSLPKNIHIFEPQHSCVLVLEKKFSNIPNVLINNFGLSNEKRSTLLYKDFDQSGLASVHSRNLAYCGISHNNITEQISLNKASDYIKEKGIEKIDLIKMDVEGHELSVLEGFGSFITPQKVDFIQFEYGGANLDSRTNLLEFFTYFEKRGYIICKIMPRNLEVRVYHQRLENFMYANYVAVNPKFTGTQQKPV